MRPTTPRAFQIYGFACMVCFTRIWYDKLDTSILYELHVINEFTYNSMCMCAFVRVCSWKNRKGLCQRNLHPIKVFKKSSFPTLQFHNKQHSDSHVLKHEYIKNLVVFILFALVDLHGQRIVHVWGTWTLTQIIQVELFNSPYVIQMHYSNNQQVLDKTCTSHT